MHIEGAQCTVVLCGALLSHFVLSRHSRARFCSVHVPTVEGVIRVALSQSQTSPAVEDVMIHFICTNYRSVDSIPFTVGEAECGAVRRCVAVGVVRA